MMQLLVVPPKAGLEERGGIGDGDKCSFTRDRELLPFTGAQRHHRQGQRSAGGMGGALLQGSFSLWQYVPACRTHPLA